MALRKVLMTAIIALMLPAASMGASTSASAGWLVRGYPVYLGYHRFYHHRYVYRRLAPFSGRVGGGCCPNSMLVCPLGRHFC